MAPEKLVVAGTGRAGTGVGLAFASAGFDVTFLTTGERRFVGGVPALPADDPEFPKGVDWLILAVPDREIARTAESLFDLGVRAPDTLVGHLSGALPSSAVARTDDAHNCFSAHPLFSFPPPDPPLPMPAGVLVTIETASPRVDGISDLFTRTGAKTATMAAADRALYHAAAVMCANLPMALVYDAAALFDECGVPDANEAAVALLMSVVRNQAKAPGADGITGPIARADGLTIARNLAALSHRDPEAADLYRTLGERLADILYRNSILSEDSWNQIRKILK